MCTLYVFVDGCLSFCPFSSGHCVVCSSLIYTDSDYPFGFFKLFLCTWFVNPTFFILLYFLSSVVALSVFIVNFYILHMILLYSLCQECEYLCSHLHVLICFSGIQHEFHIIRCSRRFHSIKMSVNSGGGT